MKSRPRSVVKRLLLGGSLVLTTGYMFQLGTGCASFSGEQALIATDFCFIFDCNNGALGGTIQPCRGAAMITGDGEVVGGRAPLFVDCNFQQP